MINDITSTHTSLNNDLSKRNNSTRQEINKKVHLLESETERRRLLELCERLVRELEARSQLAFSCLLGMLNESVHEFKVISSFALKPCEHQLNILKSGRPSYAIRATVGDNVTSMRLLEKTC